MESKRTESTTTAAEPGGRSMALRLVEAWWAAHSQPQPNGYPRGAPWDNVARCMGGGAWAPRRGAAAWCVALAGVLALLPALTLLVDGDDDGAVGRAHAALAAVWLASLNAAFAYVSYVTTHRASALRGRHGGFRDLVICNALGVAMYAFAVLPHLRRRSRSPEAEGGALAAWAHWAAHVALPLFAGLHISYGHLLPHSQAMSLSSRNIRAALRPGGAPWLTRAVLVLLTGLILTGLWSSLRPMVEAGGFVAGSDGVVLAVLVAVAAVTRAPSVRAAGYHFHLHHWFVCAVAALLSHGTSLAVVAALAGACVEGLARWSAAPLWHGKWPSR